MARPIRVLQFGTGVLMRGLCCEIIDRALRDRLHPWDGAVAVVQSTGADRADAFARAGHRYPIYTRGLRDGQPIESEHIATCVSRAFAAERDWAAILDVARSEHLSVILSNTTEAGLIARDDDTPDDKVPRSYPAKLLRVLCARFEAGSTDPAVIVMPCELVERNGAFLRHETIELADRFGVDKDARQWIANEVVFANTLVDRICTRPSTGELSALGVVVEPFAQWAIELPKDRHTDIAFASGVEGAEFVTDVDPYFTRKVRVLNGAHTAVVHLGLLAGHTTMRELCDDALFMRFLRTLLEREIIPPLLAAGIPGVQRFATEVLDRFANPFASHQLNDIAIGTQTKILIRLVPTIEATVTSPCACLGVAAWLLRSGNMPEASWSEKMRAQVLDQVERLKTLDATLAIERAIDA